MHIPAPMLARWTGVLPALLPVAFFAACVFAPPLNHDVAAILAFSERWRDGERLYVDLIDVNPPLIFILNLLPAWLAQTTGVDAVAALHLCLLAWGLIVWALAWLLRPRGGGPVERMLIRVLPGLFVFGAGYDFGQREHLMAASALPYLFAAARRAQGEAPRGAIVAAVLAAVGFALKPHFLAVPALVEAAVFASRATLGLWPARRDAVPWTMIAIWTAYAVTLPLLFPAYLFGVVPLVWDLYLGLGGLGVTDMLLTPRLGTALLLLAPLLWLVARRWRTPDGALPRMLAAAALGGAAAAVVQRKGWSYHVVPLQMFTLALASLLAARFLDGLHAARAVAAPRIVGVIGAGFVLFAAANGETPWNQLTYGSSDVAHLTAALRRAAEGGRVLVLSPLVSPIFPALNYAHARLTLRMMDMWMLEGSTAACLPDGRRYRAPADMGPAEAFVYRTVSEDFARAPPDAVIIDRYAGVPDCAGQAFDFLAYFTRQDRFAASWSHYRINAEWGRFRLYTRGG
jgi:hypothetical protein